MDREENNTETIYVITQKDTYRDEIPDLSACTSKERAEERFHDILDALWDPDDPEHRGTDNNGNTYEDCLTSMEYDDGYDSVRVDQLELEHPRAKNPILDAVRQMKESGMKDKDIQKQLDAARQMLGKSGIR